AAGHRRRRSRRRAGADRGAAAARTAEDASPLIAELFRDWHAEHGLPTGRLLVSSFLIMDPTLAMRTGLVPSWALFGTRPSLDRLAGYLSRTAYDDSRLTVFPHGEDSIGLPGIGEWQAVMVGVLAEHRSKVPFAVDQHPVGAFGSCGAYPSL